VTVMPASAAFALARNRAALPLNTQAAAAAAGAPSPSRVAANAAANANATANATANADAKGAAHNAEMRKAAQAFEAVFLRQMISTMRSATPGESLLGSDAGNQFRDLMDSRLADDMAGKQKFGIASMLLKQFGVDET